jgi:hypothetical protein
VRKAALGSGQFPRYTRRPDFGAEGTGMKRLAGFLLMVSAGCSTRPLADFCDRFFPPRAIPPNSQAFGGVQNQLAPPPGAILQPPPPGAELPGLPVPTAP